MILCLSGFQWITRYIPIYLFHDDISSSQVQYDDDNVALSDVRKNKVWGLLHFQGNYTRSLANRVTEGTKVSPEDVTSSLMNTWIDLSSMLRTLCIGKNFIS